MIQQEYKNNVKETHGDIQTTGFSIEVNESMFQMLTSNVYNDTTLAVMREWSTNACDACIAAGKEVKFDVHLPTLENPTFFVRDYGTGLPPEDIVGLFSNLGASTKRNSNAYNGTLGIGRMAGLAVANAFTVESFYNGKHYSYVISMQNGVPVTMHLGDMETTEPNGLKLSVAVDSDDIESFVSRTSSLYKYFDYKPNLVSRVELQDSLKLDVSEHISDRWFIQNNDQHYGRHNNIVVMSQVAYVIPYSREIDDKGFTGLVIKAEPGAVTFNPGRESLSLNKQTIEYLNQTFKAVAEEYVQAATAAFALCENDKDLINTYYKIYQVAPRDIAEAINPEPFASDLLKSMASTQRYYTNNKSIKFLACTQAFTSHTNNLLELSKKERYYKNSKPMHSTTPVTANEFFNYNHVIVDVKTKFRAALNETYEGKSLITWSRRNGANIDEAVEKAKECLDLLNIPYVLVSELIEDFTTQESSKNAPREGLYVSDIENKNVYKSKKMSNDEITSKDYLKVNLKNTTPVMSSENKSFQMYMQAYNLLKKASSTALPEIKGVPKKYQSYVDKLDNWIDFEEYIEQKMKETTFKVPYTINLQTTSFSIINKDLASSYPRDIQDYYFELKNYRIFLCDAISPDEMTIVEYFSSKKEEYIPAKVIDMEELETKYPKTLPLLSGGYNIDKDLVIHLAMLEDFYALHSTK